MEAYAGIDLHSSNNYIGVIDGQDRRLYRKRLPNDLDTILSALAPFRKDLVGIVVESTFNWYWLVDGLQEDGYKVHLANPAAIKQYEGLKHTDDDWDSFWLAHMRRLNILPEGYIYPKEHRPVRDLLRRRLLFVKHRTAHILSLQSMISRNLGTRMSVRAIKKLTEADADDLFDSPTLVFAASNNIVTISHLTKIVKSIEKEVMSQVKLRKEFKLLLTIPGKGWRLLFLLSMCKKREVLQWQEKGRKQQEEWQQVPIMGICRSSEFCHQILSKSAKILSTQKGQN